MTEICLPSALRHAKNSFRYLDNTGISRGNFGGGIQTTGYGGDRVGCTIDFTTHGGRTTTGKAELAQVQAFLMSLRGRQNRVYIQDNSYTQRGSFPATELLTNTDFSNGTTGWGPAGNCTLSASDGAGKLVAIASGGQFGFAQTPALVAYVPYAMRSVVVDGAQSSGLTGGPILYTNAATLSSSNYTSTRGYLVASLVSDSSASSAGAYPFNLSSTSGYTAGMYVLVQFASASRCILSDSGGNLLLQSENFTATWANTRSSDSANTTTSPDGTATADSIIEDGTAANTHLIAQSQTVPSSAADFSFSVALKANTRTWARLTINESAGSTNAGSYFNLSTGALGTLSTGAGWSNVRAFISSMGNGWYRCTVVGRKTSAGTALSAQIRLATADGGEVYSGDGASSIYAWRATMSQSSLPTKLVSTTTTAQSADSQSGSAINVKGLPASTSGLLLLGDWIEIDGQLKMVAASLDSGADGIGYLQFSPPLRRAIADNTPIIVHKPMGRFFVPGGAGWNNSPGVFSDASIELEECWA